MTQAAAARRVFAAPRALRSIWRRSLMLRVTTLSVVSSVIVVGLLGLLLLNQVTAGLLDAKEQTSLTEATAGLNEAQRLLNAADTGPTTPSPSRLVDSAVTALAARAGAPGQFDVLLLSAGEDPSAPERGTNLVAVSSVPLELRESVASTGRQAWTYTEIQYLSGQSVAGLIIGAPITVPTVGRYELYYLFPLTQEQATLDLVQRSVVGTGLLLVILVASIGFITTRLVVSPVRAAARTAERFSVGHLEERMKVRGEDDLSALATSFNTMASSIEVQIQTLERLSRVQQRFVSDVSHELRTPLTTIRMAADVIADVKDDFDPATARSVELLQTQLDRFESLLADLLEISRYDAGAALLEGDDIDVLMLVRRVVEASIPLADRYGSEIVVTTDGNDATAYVDARRVDRILRNLLDNAIEHGEGRQVAVTVGADENAVAVTVRDYGVGLKPGEAGLVFNRFWRADPSRQRTTGGTGLGLAIALGDAMLHGGWLEAWGEPGQGACFRLTVPRRAGGGLERSPLPLVPADYEDDGRTWTIIGTFGERSRVTS